MQRSSRVINLTLLVLVVGCFLLLFFFFFFFFVLFFVFFFFVVFFFLQWGVWCFICLTLLQEFYKLVQTTDKKKRSQEFMWKEKKKDSM